jgi:hypothetical protein
MKGKDHLGLNQARQEVIGAALVVDRTLGKLAETCDRLSLAQEEENTYSGTLEAIIRNLRGQVTSMKRLAQVLDTEMCHLGTVQAVTDAGSVLELSEAQNGYYISFHRGGSDAEPLTHGIGDGVDMVFNSEGQALSPGTPEFNAALAEDFRNSWRTWLEAHFGPEPEPPGPYTTVHMIAEENRKAVVLAVENFDPSDSYHASIKRAARVLCDMGYGQYLYVTQYGSGLTTWLRPASREVTEPMPPKNISVDQRGRIVE